MRKRKMWLAWVVTAGALLLPRTVHGQDGSILAPPPVSPDPLVKPLSQIFDDASPGMMPSGPPEPIPVNRSQSLADILDEFLRMPSFRTVRAQNMGPEDPTLPIPLGHNGQESGGLFLAAEFSMLRQTVPLRNQPIAYRGFIDADGSLTGTPGTKVGSFTQALNVTDASGPKTYQPGMRLTGGWRFEDGSAFEISWLQMIKAEYVATANIIPPNFQVGGLLEETFLFSPVYNFPIAFAGSPYKINQTPLSTVAPPAVAVQPNPFAAYGIWNAASQMQIAFTQRTVEIDGTFRKPIYEDENWRAYGLMGPRFFWIWERFRWMTSDTPVAAPPGQPTFGANPDPTGPDDVAIYNNIVSNRMYGAQVGMGNEWWLGNGFAVTLDLKAAAMLDIVHERATYELQDKSVPPAKRAKVDYTMVPELEANLRLYWYPIESVQIRAGYNAMAFFNTVAAPNPVSFNFGALDPAWEKGIFRWFDGFDVGIAFVF